MSARRRIRLEVNGHPLEVDVAAHQSLTEVLRTEAGATDVKYGCGEGVCGACTVAVDGVAVRSCQTPLAAVDGKKVVTIEGLEHDGKLHPLQQAFIDHGAFQCGYCTSGMLMNAWAFLQKNPHPTHSAIVDEMGGNLCRCSAYARILTAIEETSKGGSAAPKAGGAR